MILMIEGLFKSDANPQDQSLSARMNEEMAFEHLRLAGSIFNHQGTEIGFTAILDVESFDTAERYLSQSVYRASGLYDTTRIVHFRPQVGRIG